MTIYEFIIIVVFGIFAVTALFRVGRRHTEQIATVVSGKTHKEIKKEFKGIEKEALSACKEYSGLRFLNKLCYRRCLDLSDLNACTLKPTRTIAYSPLWIFLCTADMFCNRDDWRIAFMQSVGHELGHQFDKRKDFLFGLRHSYEERRLFYWLREVACDIYSLGFMAKQFPCFVSRFRGALDLKIWKYMNQMTGKEKFFRHPTWAIRKKVIFEFALAKDPVRNPRLCESSKIIKGLTKEIIDFLANEAGCTNEKYIKKMYKLYNIET